MKNVYRNSFNEMYRQTDSVKQYFANGYPTY